MKNKHLLYILLFLNSVIIAKAQPSCVNTPSVSVNLTGLCAGKSELLTATPTNGGSTPFYTWKLNNVILPIFTNKTTEAGLSDNTINEVYAIGSNIYAATSLGLNISTNSGSTFSNRTKAANGLGNDLVNGLFVTATKIYAATAGGLSISDNNGATFSNKTTANGLGSNIVNDVFVDGNKVYVATLSGLSISIDGGVSFTNKSMSSVRGIFVDGNNVYAATSTGLNVSTDAGANFNLKTTTNGLGNNNVNDVYKVGTKIYVATSGGLSISSDNGNSFINKTTANGLGNNNVSSVFAIDSFVYASTVGGLSMSNDNGNSFFINKTTTDGLGTNTVNDAFALGNNIYAATTGGLAIATINTLQVNDAKANDVYSVTMLPSTADCPTATATITIYPLPIPNITTNSPVCTAMPLNLNAANERISAGNTYSWTGPNAYASTNQNLSFSETTVTLSGTYSITITDANGCTATAVTSVIVNPLPIPTIGSNSPICTGFTLNLTSSNTRTAIGNTYAWTGPNAYTSANQNPSITNANTTMSGTYSVTITDANGCTVTATTAVTVNPLPTPSVSNNSPICSGFTLNLTATNTRNETGNAYAWTGPNTYVSTNQNPSFANATVALSGTYSVTITDLNGCTATATTAATVNPLPTPNVSNNSPICTGFTFILTATNIRNETGNAYAWTGPNAYSSTNQNPSFPSATVSLSGTYSVTITDLNGCTATATTAATVNPLPIPSVSNNSPICSGFTLNLNATNTRNETGNTYAWTGPNAYASTNQNPFFANATVALSGTYSVTITDLNGCTATATTNAIVNPFPIPSVSNNSPICTGFTLNLTATNTRNETGNSYTWTGPNAYTSTNQNPSFPDATVALSGTYSVTITDINGCTATAITSAIVNPLPIPSVSNNSPICTAFTLNLTATNTINETGNSYAWAGLNAYSSANQNPSFPNATVALSGTYSVTITDINGCTATAITSAIVNPLPIPSVSNNSPICTAFTLNLTATNTRNTVGNTYAWTGPNAYSSANQNPSFPNATVALSGTYSVTITDLNGCTATATTAAVVNPLPIPSVSNNSPICTAFTLNLTATNTRNTVGNTYAWTGPNAYSSANQNPSFPNATVALSGTYSVTITDVNECTATAITSAIVNPLPIPSVANNSPICTAFILNLTATNTRNTVGNTYAWTGPNAYSSTNQNPSFPNAIVALSGTYSVTITDLNGCTATAITSAIVNPLPIPSVANNSPICTAFTLNLTTTNTRNAVGNTYAWTGPNAYSSTNQNPSFPNATVALSGTYSVTITDVNECTATATTSAIVNPLPIPSVANNSPICTAFTLNLTATNTRNAVENTYAWTGPNAYSSTNQNPSFPSAIVALSGTYSVTITDINGCTATATTTAIVNPLPIPSVANNSPVCTPFPLYFNAANLRNANGNNYSWTGPNAYVSTNQNPSLMNTNTSMSGIYSVTITDVNGCTATATTVAIVNPLPIPSVANNSPICSEFTLNLNVTNTRNETGNSYAWTGPNAYSSNIQNPSFANATVALSGVYKVTITDLNGCTATATTSVIVKPKPPVPVISVPSQSVVCFPNTLTLTANGCAGTVTWSDNSTGSSMTLSTIGTYSLSAICTLDGCVSETSPLITGLEIKVAPTAQASNGGPYIVGQTINLSASNGPNYSWTGPNNFTSLVSSPTISNATLQNSGIYSVTVSINGCNATATTNVVVNNFAPCSPQRIVDYSYVKAGNPHQPLFPLSDGMVIQQTTQQSSIIVKPVCPTINIESFEMKITGPELNYLTVQNVSYFALFSNEEENVFGRNFTPGNYTLTVTGYSQDDKNGAIVYGPVVTTFKVVGTLGMISIPTLSSQSICAGSNIDVSFTTIGNFNQVDQFQVQLSDASGSFQNPTTIGTSNTTGTVSCFIPANLTEGTNYLIRVASSNQTAVGNPTMSAITVNPLNSNISQNILTGTVTNKATQSLSATNKIIAPANVSYQAGKVISLNAGFEAGNGSVFKAEIKTCTN